MEAFSKQRDSNFEFLRILAMLAIVAGSFSAQSGVYIEGSNFNRNFAMLLGSGLQIVNNLFLMVGCWFILNSQKKQEEGLWCR